MFRRCKAKTDAGAEACPAATINAFHAVKLRTDYGEPDNVANDLYVDQLDVDNLAPGVADGTHLHQRQRIPKSGNSGCSSGPHMHIATASVAGGQNAVLNTCTSFDPGSRYGP